MGISLTSYLPNRMVAAQVYIALCAASVAVAAPQLNFAGLRSVSTTRGVGTNVNEQEVVSNVVSALQPSIAKAVADALAGLQTSTFTSSLSSSQSSSSSADAASADVGPTAKAEYNFEYKVADNDAQTYISQSENRDGDSLTGTYSYVNPAGSLITVNYQAGPMGYTQTSSEETGFVDIRAQPVRSNAAAEEDARIAAQQAAAQRARAEAEQRARAQAARLAAEQRAAAEAAAAAEEARLAAEQRAADEAARLAAEQAASQQSLIAQIISSLQPQISSAVQSAISSSSTTSTTLREVPVRVAPVAAAGGDLSSTFGNGFSVKIDTPEFNIAY